MGFEIDDDLINEDEGVWAEPKAIAPSRGGARFSFATLFWGAAFGAVCAYFLDPVQGRRRRIMFRDRRGRWARETNEWTMKKERHLSHILSGLPHRVSRFSPWSEDVEDERLVQRVRSEMGRATRHPGSIEVSARDGRVTLRGPVLADEVERVVKCVRAVSGVKHVVNDMQVYTRPARVPGLQGEGKAYLNT